MRLIYLLFLQPFYSTCSIITYLSCIICELCTQVSPPPLMTVNLHSI